MNGLKIFVQTGFGVDIILPFMCTWHCSVHVQPPS